MAAGRGSAVASFEYHPRSEATTYPRTEMFPTVERRLLRLHPAARIAATALLVAASYYVGANFGFILRLPPSVPSVVWPPNSILTATLLLAAPRRWWIYLLAAFPAHLAAELPAFPVPLVLAFFATNCSEALIAAICVRRFSADPARLDTLRRVVVFIAGAALLAPFLSSFADAAAVAWLRGDPYWVVWRTRCSSNILTELTVAPAILTSVYALREPLRLSSRRHRAEAALLAVLLVTVAVLVFAGSSDALAEVTESTRWPAVLLFPFLLWAAVRFAPLGASLSLLITTAIAIWGATHGRGPFRILPAAEYVPALQIFLSVIAIPLLCVAALVEERRRVEDDLADRLRFEEFLARLSAAFVHAPGHRLDEAVADALRRTGEFLQLDRVLLLRFVPGSRSLDLAACWAAGGFDRAPRVIPGRDCPGAAARLLQHEPFVFSQRADGRPPLDGADVRSSLTLPVEGTGPARGALALDSIAADRNWPRELVDRLQLVAEVLANVLARQEAEDALRTSEVMKSAILSSLSNGVAVLGREGRIIAVNESWSRLGAEAGPTPYAGAALGADYLELCREAVRKGLARASEMLAGTTQVLDGSRAGFSFEYSTPADRPERWFALSIVPLNRREGGAVVSHTDVTEQKRAEVEVQLSRQELAHFARVSAMGELTASLAHELRQPLTGIMSNAQAARRFLGAVDPQVGEVRGCLEDIIADTQRAAETIQRLRAVLRKSDLPHSPLDLNDLIGDVTRLLGTDAIIRSTTVTLEPASAPVVVTGDRVQLGQVILNLLMNAMDAVTAVPEAQRKVVVRTEGAQSRAHVAVEDAGPGLEPQALERLFQPFYTTKVSGMGMGLSIARSIVEAHGGKIWATNNRTRGATFHFTLPTAGARAS